jgi:hypothetical protein
MPFHKNWKPPKVNIPTIPTPTIPTIPTPSYGGSTTPNIPIPNIPAPGGSFADIPGGISLLTENAAYVVGGAVDIVRGAGDRLAKAGKEALTGEGGYVDDQPGAPPGPGPTGFEDATGTLLTRGRKRELPKGRGFHSGGGTASQVGPR